MENWPLPTRPSHNSAMTCRSNPNCCRSTRMTLTTAARKEVCALIVLIDLLLFWLAETNFLFLFRNAVRAFTCDLLQRKVKGLEDDNRKLRAEASQLASDSSECELREEQLLHDVLAQLGNNPAILPFS